MLFAIHPTCDECGRQLVKVRSGLVCIEGHGRIIPIDEYVDRSKIPVDHSKCEKIQQQPFAFQCREIRRAAVARARERRQAPPEDETV